MNRIRDSILLRVYLGKWGAFSSLLMLLFLIAGVLAIVWVETTGVVSNISYLLAIMVMALLSGHVLQMVLRVLFNLQAIARFLWRAHIPPYTAASLTYSGRVIVPRQGDLARRRLFHAVYAFLGWWLIVLIVGGYLVSSEPAWVSRLTTHWGMKILLAVSAVLLQLPLAIVEASPFSLPPLDHYQSALFILIAVSIFPSAAVAGALMQIVEESLLRGLQVSEARDKLVEGEEVFATIIIIVASSGLLAYTVMMLT